MQIQIIRRGKEIARQTESHTVERVQASLGRFKHWVRGVLVKLADVNGPRGGADDKSVAIEVSLAATGPMRFEGRSNTYERALAIALSRTKRSLLASPELGSRRPVRGAGIAGGSS